MSDLLLFLRFACFLTEKVLVEGEVALAKPYLLLSSLMYLPSVVNVSQVVGGAGLGGLNQHDQSIWTFECELDASCGVSTRKRKKKVLSGDVLGVVKVQEQRWEYTCSRGPQNRPL